MATSRTYGGEIESADDRSEAVINELRKKDPLIDKMLIMKEREKTFKEAVHRLALNEESHSRLQSEVTQARTDCLNAITDYNDAMDEYKLGIGV